MRVIIFSIIFKQTRYWHNGMAAATATQKFTIQTVITTEMLWLLLKDIPLTHSQFLEPAKWQF